MKKGYTAMYNLNLSLKNAVNVVGLLRAVEHRRL
jgi:hypothetical protein